MEIKINIYGDCTAEKPTKTYTIRRITFKAAKELNALMDDAKKATDEEQISFTTKMLKAVIPDFIDEDFDGIDPVELGEFFKKIGATINGVVANAQKN